MRDISAKILVALDEVLGTPDTSIPLHEPEITEQDKILVAKCLNSGWVSTVGDYVSQFEKLIEQFTGAKHAIAVVNGTAALHIALLLAGVRKGDEVLIPSLTFVATTNAVSYCGAIPHFVDSEMNSLAIDPDKLNSYLENIAEETKGGFRNKKTGRIIRAVIPVHILGQPAEINSLLAISKRYNLKLIEDAAESLGTFVEGKHTGTFGIVGTLSFNGNKIITTGGGGAILVNDSNLEELARHLTTTARIKSGVEFTHDQMGFNYRLPNLNAALGCSQILALEGHLHRKRTLAESYIKAMGSKEGIKMISERSGVKANYWLNGFILDSANLEERNNIIETTNAVGYQTRPAWMPMLFLPMYKDCPRMDLWGAEKIYKSLICLPSSSFLAHLSD